MDTPMTGNNKLGRGLSAFLNVENNENSNALTNNVIKIPLGDVIPNPFQPRKVFNQENLESLSESIKKKGVIQPIIVVKVDDGKYQIIAGERRWRASKIAGLIDIPAITIEVSKVEQLEIAILENVQREDLNPIEEAQSYKRLVDEFGYTQEELASSIGKSRSHISNVLRLLTLPEDVQSMLMQEQLTFGHARAIIGDANASAVAKQIVEQNLNVRQTEDLMKTRKSALENSENVGVSKSMRSDCSFQQRYCDPEITNLSMQLSDLLGLNVGINVKSNSSGSVEIRFKNFSELDKLVEKLQSRIVR